MTRIRRGQFTEFGIMADEIQERSTIQRNESGRCVVQNSGKTLSSSIAFLSLPLSMGHDLKINAYSPFDNDVYSMAKPRPPPRLHEYVPQMRNQARDTSLQWIDDEETRLQPDRDDQ